MANPLAVSLACLAALMLGMLLCLEVGYRVRRRHEQRGLPREEGEGSFEGAAFALFGLLIAFTFAGAASRFDERRELTVEEVNLIGTLWLRLDLLPPESRPAMQKLLVEYLDSRIAIYRAVPDMARVQQETDRSTELQGRFWNGVVAATQAPGAATSAQMLVLANTNDMLDITTTRSAATLIHTPPVVYLLLVVSGLVTALLAGYSMGRTERRSWIHILGFVFLVGFAVYIIIDLEYPRLGLVRVDALDQLMVDLRATMVIPGS